MANDSMLMAWGDESAKMRHNPPMYLMCASVFEEGSEEGLAELTKAKPAGMRKLHWYDMEVREKARSLEAIARIRVQRVHPDAGEVRLWIPDQILGAIGDMFVGAEGTDKWGKYWDEIDSHITLLMATLH